MARPLDQPFGIDPSIAEIALGFALGEARFLGQLRRPPPP
jgi:hypothetical protein